MSFLCVLFKPSVGYVRCKITVPSPKTQQLPSVDSVRSWPSQKIQSYRALTLLGLISSLLYPLTMRVVGAPQMISQPVSRAGKKNKKCVGSVRSGAGQNLSVFHLLPGTLTFYFLPPGSFNYISHLLFKHKVTCVINKWIRQLLVIRWTVLRPDTTWLI